MLLLFDIDGTILQGAAAAHASALRAALHEVYGVGDGTGLAESVPKVQAAGRTDMEIAREIVLAWGSSAEVFEAGSERLKQICVRAYESLDLKHLRSCLVPGMEELLADLAAREDVRLALLTGNLEPIARAKLAGAGVGHHFPSGQGAFGSDSERRADLPAVARARAGIDGQPYPRQRTVIIGDTPRDIACARADGVRCLAVTSGPYDASQLGDADAIAHSTAQLRELLEQELSRVHA
ncbi:MAG TPA: haloacid dehalogenase-like hydrolase [Solirubrobacteraceae bacterium]